MVWADRLKYICIYYERNQNKRMYHLPYRRYFLRDEIFAKSLKTGKIPMQKQTIGSNNCGVFAVAVCVAILLKKDPSHIVFDEDKMRSHLCSCFEEKCMSSFPCVQ